MSRPITPTPGKTTVITAPPRPRRASATIIEQLEQRSSRELTIDVLGGARRGGKRFGRYTHVERMAEGGMGAILRGIDPDLGRPVAIKVMLGGTRRPDQLARFLREAQITGQLAHPSIPPLYEMGCTPRGVAYFSLKLIEGQTLEELIEAGQVSQREMLRAMLKVCEALDYAHSRGVVHRDLKPANIMIGAFGEALVMDWGVARIIDGHELATDGERVGAPALTHDGSIVGTPAYMAPEQARGQLDRIDARTDVYGCGAILFEILTGTPPFPGDNTWDVIRSVSKGRLEAPSARASALARSSELDALVLKAMALDPDDRYASAGALAADLADYLAGRTISAARYTPLQQLLKWAARNRALASVCVTSLLVALGLLSWLAVSWRATSRARHEAASALEALGDAGMIEGLLARREQAWLAFPEELEPFERWLGDVEPLLARESVHAAYLAGEQATSSPADPRQAWRIRQRESILAGLRELHGARAELQRGLRRGRATQRTLREQADRWRVACAEIADRRRCPAYLGLQLEPIAGLTPLERDPRSGLWEFLVVDSGTPPRRGPDGAWRLLPETGIVLVLVPGGRVQLSDGDEEKHQGEENDDDEDDDDDDDDNDDDQDERRWIRLAPFLIGKYELTQAQWQRLSGQNPSEHRAGREGGPTHPVERVDWHQASRELRRLGLRLPSEAQWQLAAQGAADAPAAPWWTGADSASLEGAANLADLRFARVEGGEHLPWDDGFLRHAPVGRYRANPFGLHDTIGNVQEWCADDWLPRASALPRDGRPGLATPRSRRRAVRGGSFEELPAKASATLRHGESAGDFSDDLGLRAARPLRLR